jgi:hypothetical protein
MFPVSLWVVSFIGVACFSQSLCSEKIKPCAYGSKEVILMTPLTRESV